MLFITYMENLIIDIQGSEIWQYIHSNKTLDEIMIYLQKDARIIQNLRSLLIL